MQVLRIISTKELLVGMITNRSVKKGDIVDIDYVGKKDGVAFQGGTAQGYRLAIGSWFFYTRI